MNTTGQFERITWFVPFVARARLGLPCNRDTRSGARGFGGEAVNLGKATAPVLFQPRAAFSNSFLIGVATSLRHANCRANAAFLSATSLAVFAKAIG